MIPASTLSRMLRTIQQMPELYGCRIVLYGNGRCEMLDSGIMPSENYRKAMVFIEELEINDPAVDLDTARWASVQGGSPPGAVNPTVITNKSKLSAELTGAGIACGLTVVSAGVMLVGGAFTVPTGGAAVALFVAGWVGLATSAVQCGNGIARVMEAREHPDDDSLALVDNDPDYLHLWLVVDGIGVLTAVASLPAAWKNLGQVKRLWDLMKSSRAMAGRSEEALKAMNRMERARVMKEALDEVSKTPFGRQVAESALKEAKINQANLIARNSLSVKNAANLNRALSDQVMRQLMINLTSGAAAIVGPTASGMKSESVGSASGSVNWIIHVLDGGN